MARCAVPARVVAGGTHGERHWQSKGLRRCTRRGHRSAMSLPKQTLSNAVDSSDDRAANAHFALFAEHVNPQRLWLAKAMLECCGLVCACPRDCGINPAPRSQLDADTGLPDARRAVGPIARACGSQRGWITAK